MSTITKEQVTALLKTVKDPELMMDIHSLGLIYDIAIGPDGIDILMTLTTPFCPFGDQIVQNVEKALKPLGVEVRVEITFEPEWQPPEDLHIAMGM
jgi:metal-sulfur cluster biosynthetic enzyme